MRWLSLLVVLTACTTPYVRPVRPLPRGGHEVGASIEPTLGYGAFYRYGVTERVMVGAGAGSGYGAPDLEIARGAALGELHYALITPQQRLRFAEFLTLSFETAWQAFEDRTYDEEDFLHFDVTGVSGTRGSRLLFQPGVFWGFGEEVAAFHLGARAQIVHVLSCENAVPAQDALCPRREVTRERNFINGVFQAGLELKLGPVVPYGVFALDTRKSVAVGGGLGVRFGGQR